MAEEQQASAEATQDIVIRCTKCGETFAPDLKLKKDPWFCTQCGAKNPNLRRHFRSVADFFILCLAVTVGVLVYGFSQGKSVTARSIVLTVWAVLLLVATIRIYTVRMPWRDRLGRGLIWVVLALIVADRIVMLVLLPRGMSIPLLVIPIAVLIYVIWVFRAASQCTIGEGS